jgi:DHA1 family multidrug resistance protein-like MFS transporter
MWSVKQYKEIGKEVERNWQREEKQRQLRTNHSSGQNEPSLDREESRVAGSLGGLRGSGTSNEDLEKEHTPSELDDSGCIIVECTSDNDPINPRNWPLATRAKTVAILCMLVFVQAYAAASDSLANSKASKQYHVSSVADNLTTAMTLFGIGFGCLLVGPLSQSFGRNPVYLTFSFAYLFFVLGSALSSTFGSQIVCRFFVGLSSSATLGINGASIGDMFSPVERTLWFPIIAWVNVVREYFYIPLYRPATNSVSTGDSSNRRRMGGFRGRFAMAMDGLDFTHHLDLRFHYRILVPSGNIHANATGVESRTPAQSYWRQSLRVQA